jgi:hypothetical protein
MHQIGGTYEDKKVRQDERDGLLDELCAKDPNKSDFVGLSWQQPLRVLHKLGHHVEAVGVLLSGEVSKEFDDFKALVEGLRPGTIVLPSESAVDLEDYNQIETGLSDLIDKCLEKTGADEKSVCIDITSMNKVYTAAATIKTLNNRAVFSYASTDRDHIGEVRTYDAKLD